jgi:hypothetical protein
MEPVMETTSERESKLQSLADRLQFRITKTQDRYTLTRTADVPRPVCEEGLTLEQAEDMLQTWKLRGLHGG